MNSNIDSLWNEYYRLKSEEKSGINTSKSLTNFAEQVALIAESQTDISDIEDLENIFYKCEETLLFNYGQACSKIFPAKKIIRHRPKKMDTVNKETKEYVTLEFLDSWKDLHESDNNILEKIDLGYGEYATVYSSPATGLKYDEIRLHTTQGPVRIVGRKALPVVKKILGTKGNEFKESNRWSRAGMKKRVAISRDEIVKCIENSLDVDVQIKISPACLTNINKTKNDELPRRTNALTRKDQNPRYRRVRTGRRIVRKKFSS